MMKKLMGAAAVLSLATVPAMASAATNPAASLSVAKSVRSGSSSAHKNELAGGGAILAVAIVAGVVAIGVIAATKDNNPASN